MAALIALAMVFIVGGGLHEAWARAGSGGTRGSRSYSAPARPAPTSPVAPSSPSRSYEPTAPVTPAPPERPSLFRGLLGGLASFALGGLLGGMLFSGAGQGGGLGLLDLVLIGAGVMLLVALFRRRRTEEVEPAYAGMGSGYRGGEVPGPGGGASAVTEAPTVSDIERGLGHIRRMDPSFDPEALITQGREVFFDVQAAITARDVSTLRGRIAAEMLGDLQRQSDELRAARRTNRVERIDLRRSDITEVWQENGRDYVTLYFAGALLDYTLDDVTGRVVAGSATDRDSLEEFWTFSRAVGPNPWELSAIQTA